MTTPAAPVEARMTCASCGRKRLTTDQPDYDCLGMPCMSAWLLVALASHNLTVQADSGAEIERLKARISQLEGALEFYGFEERKP